MALANLSKPIRGTALLASRERRSSRVAAEQKVMQDALRRDSRACRIPRCEYRTKKLPIDACHRDHRGMGGDPRGTRTTTATVIALCRLHHSLWDRGEIDVEPLTPKGFDGVCAFYQRSESGRPECIGVEQRIGVSVTRT